MLDRGTLVLRPGLLGVRDRPASGSMLRAWVQRHRVSLPIVLGLLAVGAWVLGTGIRHYPGYADDEGTYVAQAWSVLAHGSLSHYTYWYDHPPLGWLQLALATWIAGPLLATGSAVATARSLMLVPALVSVALVYVLARRLGMRRPAAALSVLLFACSPLAVTMLRQVYLDSLALPWLLAAFVLALSPSRRLWAFAGSGACFAIAVLTKETMLIFLPALIVALGYTVDRRTRSFCLTAFVTAFLLLGIGYPLYAVLKGELLPGPGHVSLLEAIRFQLGGRPGTGSLLSSRSAAHQLVSSWLNVDPWLLALGVCGAPVGLFVKRLRPIALAIIVAVLVAFRGGYLPQPLVIGVLPFCSLIVAGLIDRSAARLRALRGEHRRVGFAALAAVLLGLAVLIVPGWQQKDSYAMSASETQPLISAERWIDSHVNRRARLLVDDTLYVDLMRAGFAPRFGAVWFYKLDFTTNLDPSIVRRLPKGWREFDYVVSSPVMRSALAQEPGGFQQVRLALANSRPVGAFGTGANRIEIRRVYGIGTGSGLIPAATPAATAKPGGSARAPARISPALPSAHAQRVPLHSPTRPAHQPRRVSTARARNSHPGRQRRTGGP